MIRFNFCWPVAVLLLVLSSCSNVNKDLEKMVPYDATGVVRVQIPKLLDEADLTHNGKYQATAAIKAMGQKSDASRICQALADLDKVGIDYGHNAYVYFTTKTFGSVLLAHIDDEETAKRYVEGITGNKLTQVKGLPCIYQGDYLYAVHNDVLFIGRVNMPVDVNAAASAAMMSLEKTKKSLFDDKSIKKSLDEDCEISAFFDMKGLNKLLNTSDTYRSILNKMPLVSLITDNDIDDVAVNVEFDDERAIIAATTNVKSGKATSGEALGQASATFLKAMPNTMKYIISASVNGNDFMAMPQTRQAISVVKKQMGGLKLDSMIAAVQGSIAIGLAPDPNFENKWNCVIAVQSPSTEMLKQQIREYAKGFGQMPDHYNNEDYYEYDNYQVTVGTVDDVLYVKMLDYQQTEGNAYDVAKMKDFFSNAQLGLFAQFKTDSTQCYFNFGYTGKEWKGEFLANGEGKNAALEFVKLMCMAQVGKADEGVPYLQPDAIDGGDEGTLPSFY